MGFIQGKKQIENRIYLVYLEPNEHGTVKDLEVDLLYKF